MQQSTRFLPSALCILLTAFLLSACGTTTEVPTVTPVSYNPFVPIEGSPASVPTSVDGTPFAFPTPTEGPFIVPTAIPLDQLLPTPRPVGMPIYTPTPDAPHSLPPLRTDEEQYIVQPGDTLGSIAQTYGVGLEALMQANGLTDANMLAVGQSLTIPVAQPLATGSAFKVIPDSELVYGPASVRFDIEKFIKERNGYLATFGQEVDGEWLNASQIILRVSQNYSVNPRLLLALIEHRSGWVNNPAPTQTDFALGIADSSRVGLYLQLTYAANELSRGYYDWRTDSVSTWVLTDGSVVPINGGINAGTAGVQNLFAKLDDLTTWKTDVGDAEGSLFYTYFFLFGSPYDFAVDPVIPDWLHQPRMALPFERGVSWLFTGGPHGGWSPGYGWAALDFAPLADASGCFQSDAWVTAATDGLILRTGNGQVIQDLDGDGYEQTGWVILYMHIEARDRVEAGTRVTGSVSRIGHPSCEGGASNATHLHLARKYNGEWVAADGHIPFVLDGWTTTSAGIEYDGYLTRGDIQLEALEGITEVNTIMR
jgi:LysM repeat protein